MVKANSLFPGVPNENLSHLENSESHLNMETPAQGPAIKDP